MKKIPSHKIALIEDHHQAYYVWKKRGFKNIGLVHIDAHIDFGFQEIKDIRLILEEAKSVSELKSQLEKAVLFKQKRFKIEKLTHIGNYIYPAMRDGIVSDFCWVIPGDKSEFRDCLKNTKSLLRGLAKKDPRPQVDLKIKDGVIKTRLYGKEFIICCLKTLPKIDKKVLLDIDTDFLITGSIKKADATVDIGKRKSWIDPKEFVKIIKRRVTNPAFITIAYSVNGGFTPLKFKYLGDEVCARLKGKVFKMPPAAQNFNIFDDLWKKRNVKEAGYYYRKAIKSDTAYRIPDNNYGPLYLAKRKYKQAEDEFKKILYVEPGNKDALCGMGEVNLGRRKYRVAEKYFTQALAISPAYPKAIFGLGRARFRLKKYKKAEKALLKYQAKEPMQPYSHYLLARIYAKQKNFFQAANQRKEAIRLGLKNLKKKRLA